GERPPTDSTTAPAGRRRSRPRDDRGSGSAERQRGADLASDPGCAILPNLSDVGPAAIQPHRRADGEPDGFDTRVHHLGRRPDAWPAVSVAGAGGPPARTGDAGSGLRSGGTELRLGAPPGALWPRRDERFWHVDHPYLGAGTRRRWISRAPIGGAGRPTRT